MSKNPLLKATVLALEQLPHKLFLDLDITTTTLLQAAPSSYTIYEPMLLTPADALGSPPWTLLLQTLSTIQKHDFFSTIASSMKTTHIARNAPISPTLTSHNLPDTGEISNIQRRPNITPLHGDFGTFISTSPTPQDFSNAFWVSIRQNGITQVFAPLYTMFSKGNITEKTRVLQLPSVREAVDDTDARGVRKGCTAVDLYAGIGYFALSYAEAGVTKVLGWELNAWSVEGLRRGAGRNRWGVDVVTEDHTTTEINPESMFTVFQMDNTTAGGIVARNRDKLPPVRHVNCGLLPSSRQSWETAVRVLDPELGGWLHIHENFGVAEIEARSEEVRLNIQEMADEISGQATEVELEHVERVKTYAPGVIHCVLDIKVGFEKA